jgi:hypothetical protein
MYSLKIQQYRMRKRVPEERTYIRSYISGVANYTSLRAPFYEAKTDKIHALNAKIH